MYSTFRVHLRNLILEEQTCTSIGYFFFWECRAELWPVSLCAFVFCDLNCIVPAATLPRDAAPSTTCQWADEWAVNAGPQPQGTLGYLEVRAAHQHQNTGECRVLSCPPVTLLLATAAGASANKSRAGRSDWQTGYTTPALQRQGRTVSCVLWLWVNATDELWW